MELVPGYPGSVLGYHGSVLGNLALWWGTLAGVLSFGPNRPVVAKEEAAVQ